MMEELKKLADGYDRLCQRIEPCDHSYSFETTRLDVGSPHVEFTEGQYHYIVTERGLDLEHRSTNDMQEILYWLIYDLTFWMGVEFELKNRVEGPDARRLIFARSLLLMERADPAMAVKLQLHIEKTLGQHPYQDRN